MCDRSRGERYGTGRGQPVDEFVHTGEVGVSQELPCQPFIDLGLLGLAYPGTPLSVESREVPVATELDSRADDTDDTENSGDLRLVHTGQSYEVRTFEALYVCAHPGAICSTRRDTALDPRGPRLLDLRPFIRRSSFVEATSTGIRYIFHGDDGDSAGARVPRSIFAARAGRSRRARVGCAFGSE